jgi:cell division protein FtsI (penicillin-binding protein 3)
MAFKIKDEVLARAYVVTAIMLIVAAAIVARGVYLITVKRDELLKQGEVQLRWKEELGERGNIMSEQGDLLATSLPMFDVSMDMFADGINESSFRDNVDSLGIYLSYYVDSSATPQQWVQFLIAHRKNKSRHVPIKRNVTIEELERIKKFPFFNLGRFRSGLKYERKSARIHPLERLAQRTLGYVSSETNVKLGIEGRFDKYLSGDRNKILMRSAGGDVFIPVEDLADIEPRNGADVVTTLDIHTQEIADAALVKALQLHQADHGCAIVMEVKTGKIKAIANIGRTRDSSWWETFNYAVGAAVEPGSTFKTASMMALLEENAVRLHDTVTINGGIAQFYDQTMEDHERTPLNKVTVQAAFAHSSNVGIALMTNNYFSTKKDKYFKYLEDFFLTLPTGVEIDGEVPPKIKNPADGNWSGTTLPWMSIGYELQITPLQLLTFYNSIANDGVMMKPYLVKELQRYGETIEKYRPTIVRKRIAKPETIEQMKLLLESVVEGGTAAHLRSKSYRFAGKTGTAQLDYENKNNKTKVGGYQASFVGYFPAENPVYSCIVVISKPKVGSYYGGAVAGPVFREIADKLMSSDLQLAEPINAKGKPVLKAGQMPDDVGYKSDLVHTLKHLGINIENRSDDKDRWTFLRGSNDTLRLYSRQMLKSDATPSVVGMGLRDALYILENRGMKVRFSGCGKVVSQSLPSGSPAKGKEIFIKLE